MTMLTRARERIETDLTDAELTLLIDEANQAVVLAVGSHADPGVPIVVSYPIRPLIDLPRPIDTAQAITVETIAEPGATPAAVAATTGYEIDNGGRTLRLADVFIGEPWSWHRSLHRGRLRITYVPLEDGNKRQEVILALVQLAVQRNGVGSYRAGDVQITSADYARERERLLASLRPRVGLIV